MKHLKSINEFRTAGFRYSEPTLTFIVSCYYIGEVTDEMLQKIFNKLSIDADSIEINQEGGVLELPTDNGVQEVEVSGAMNFNINIYNEKVIDTIISEVARLLISVYDVETINYMVKDHEKNLS